MQQSSSSSSNEYNYSSSSTYYNSHPISNPNFYPQNPPSSSSQPSYASAPPYSATDYSSPYPPPPHLSQTPDTIIPNYSQTHNPPQPYYNPPSSSYGIPDPSSYAPPPHLSATTIHQSSFYPNYQTPPNPNSIPPTINSTPLYPSDYSNPTPPTLLPTPPLSYGGGGGSFSSSTYLNDGYGYDQQSYGNDPKGYDEDAGVYAYDGGKIEPYGARGTSSGKTLTGFDDYGRATNAISGIGGVGGEVKIARAVPKQDTQQDVKNGVQKFRVKILAEGSGQTTMDVLCQIGLDGIRMLDPSTSRMLRIYPLETVTNWEVNEPSTFTFWAKTAVDLDPRRIRLQSNRYTTSTILDTVTAASVQLKEMAGAKSRVNADVNNLSEQTAEKKKSFADWMNIIKPVNEEKDHWVPDDAVTKCTSCATEFNTFNRKHHCRNCGDVFCDKCTQGRTPLTNEENAPNVRVCDRCMAEVSHRMTNAKETSKSVAVHSHEDLAKKLQEEMDKNRKSSSVAKSDGSGRRMREVACPICTVHLQVQVPTSGSETIECGVCQHPFMVSAH